MARGPREVSNTGLYHVTLKGINGMQLFSEANDFERFLGLLKNALDKTGVTLLAWCLMSNHVHLAVLDPNQMLSKMVHSVSFRFATFFNRRHARSGPLYNSRFWSEPIESEAHLLHVIRYIHRNPQAAGICEAPHYLWSSYREYTGQPTISDTRIAMAAFGTVGHFEEFMGIPGLVEAVRRKRERLSDWKAACLLSEERFVALRQPPSGRGAAGNAEMVEAIRCARKLGITYGQLCRLTELDERTVRRACRKKPVNPVALKPWTTGLSRNHQGDISVHG